MIDISRINGVYKLGDISLLREIPSNYPNYSIVIYKGDYCNIMYGIAIRFKKIVILYIIPMNKKYLLDSIKNDDFLDIVKHFALTMAVGVWDDGRIENCEVDVNDEDYCIDDLIFPNVHPLLSEEDREFINNL